MTTLLGIRGLRAWHGHSQALFGVDLDVGEGEVVALMGRNGMGKTTTIRTALGLQRPCAGEVSFGGRPIVDLAPHRIARLGIGLVPEGRRCFPNLTVRENLVSAARRGPWTLDRTRRLFHRLAGRMDQRAVTLSGGEQQMLAIGRALMTNPRLLIMDEATEGLAPLVRQEIWSALDTLKSEGLAILVVDKAVGQLLAMASRCVILEKGKSEWSGPPDAVSADVAGRYLGL
ncbi:MAG: ABC transporter ATP-binding protein [Paracoccaceae bacterium]|nr:ABC transporter ATP-binding protein [Paracoccaceae bacterium]